MLVFIHVVSSYFNCMVCALSSEEIYAVVCRALYLCGVWINWVAIFPWRKKIMWWLYGMS